MISKKILYVLDFDETWYGGINYFVNQMVGILMNSNVCITVVSSKELSAQLSKEFDRDEIKKLRVLNINFTYSNHDQIFKNKFLHFFRTILGVKNKALKKVIDVEKPDVIIHMGSVSGVYKDILQISWIPDLQHVEIPKTFLDTIA